MARYHPPIHCRSVAPMIATFLSLISPAALAQNATNSSSESTLSADFKFAGKSGEELYASVCQGCHMPDGKGATGAGAYPSIADNETLKASGYMLDVVVNGKRAMPVGRHDERRSGGRCGKLCADALQQQLSRCGNPGGCQSRPPPLKSGLIE